MQFYENFSKILDQIPTKILEIIIGMKYH